MKEKILPTIRMMVLFSLMFAGIVISVAIHEMGHSITCSYFGYDSPITLNLYASYVLCEATGIESVYVDAAGGIAALFLLPLMFSSVRRNDYVRFFLLAGGIMHLIYMPIETLFSSSYAGVLLNNVFGVFSIKDVILNTLAMAGIGITVLLEICKFKYGPLSGIKFNLKRKI